MTCVLASAPGVALEGPHFVAHLARHLAADAPVEALERLDLGGLYLACACAERVPAALAAFEAHLLPEVYVAVVLMKLDPLALDELRQRVRERMLVSTEEVPARLAAYPGTGPLAGWVRAAAVWLAQDLVRRRAGRMRSDDGASPCSSRPATTRSWPPSRRRTAPSSTPRSPRPSPRSARGSATSCA